MTTPLRIAVVGAGPSGFFLADKLTSQSEVPVAVDLFERLPVPFGLVRFGVAPDHEKIKAVTRSFDKVAARPGVRFLGNVEIGRDLSVEELRRYYHAVAFTTGAQSDRRMGIPGEDLLGSHPATEFVAWYNGHPDYRDRSFDLTAERVAVVGVGNVAIDVARILSRSPAELGTTDIADHALAALANAGVKEVYLLGRRGPVQAAFTAPEVKELGEMAQADVVVRPDEVALDPMCRDLLERENDAANTRKVEILTEFGGRTTTGKPKTLTIRFLVSPVELLGDDRGRVRAIRLARNQLTMKDGVITAVPTDQVEELPVGLVFRSVGYRGGPIDGLPFDERTGTVPNDAGRVIAAPGGEVMTGLYVAGWIKRGPSGVIGTNKPDAAETAERILADAEAGLLLDPPADAADLVTMTLATRNPEVVSWADWKKIEAAEVAAGKAQSRPRVKFTATAEMLAAR